MKKAIGFLLIVAGFAAMGGRATADVKPALPPGCPELVTAEEFRAAGGTTEDARTSRPPPPYPKGQRIDGEVELEVIIATDGAVIDVKIVSATNTSFADSAVDTIKKWRYRPGKIDGRPVCIVARVTSSFKAP